MAWEELRGREGCDGRPVSFGPFPFLKGDAQLQANQTSAEQKRGWQGQVTNPDRDDTAKDSLASPNHLPQSHDC